MAEVARNAGREFPLDLRKTLRLESAPQPPACQGTYAAQALNIFRVRRALGDGRQRGTQFDIIFWTLCAAAVRIGSLLVSREIARAIRALTLRLRSFRFERDLQIRRCPRTA